MSKKLRRKMMMSDTHHLGASRTAREIKDWMPSTTSADSALLPEITILQDRNQDLYRNNGIAAGVKQTSKDNVIGTGLRLNSKPNYRLLGKDITWANEFAKQAEALWEDYSESVFFDAGLSLNFDAFTNLNYDSVIQNGEAAIIPLWIPGRGSKISTCFQAIDTARLCNPNNQIDTPSLRGGISFDQYGAPTAYHVKKTHPGDNYFMAGGEGWETIPARTEFGRKRFLHIFKKERPGQSRGKAIASSVLAAFNLLGKYQLTELQAAHVNSKVAMILESDMSVEQACQMLGITPQEYFTERNDWRGSLESAATIKLPVGDKFNSHVPNRPATAYVGYMEQLAREIGAGFNIPYELVMKDFSKTNYSSARAALLEAWRFFHSERRWFSSMWCDEVWMLILEEMVNKKMIDAPGFYQNKRAYCGAEWIGPGRGAIDPLKEGKADIEELNNNLTTYKDAYAKRGKDYLQEFDQIAIEKAEMKERGITVQDVSSRLSFKGNEYPEDESQEEL